MKNIIFIKSFLLFFVCSLYAVDEDKFMLGKSFFTIPWVEAPSATTARDGLGPLYNANSCVACHPFDGKGMLYTKTGSVSRSLIAKLSIEANNSFEHQNFLNYKGFVPEPVYGNQLSINATFGVKPEGIVDVSFEEKELTFFDGEKQVLLKPKYKVVDLNYGDMQPNTNISYRMAPTLYGLGLIDQISNEDILANEDVDDRDGDGISGKANFVYSNITKKYELGKFTYKASVPFFKEQIAGAAINDMGITTSIFQNENCTKFQKECNDAPKAKDKIDLPDNRLDAIKYYIENLKVNSTKKDEKYISGLAIFESLSCAKCHITTFKTKQNEVINPFSDFLLHDMGDDLADGRVEFKASKNEWRTTPLWGISLYEKMNKQKQRFLHDGRARDIQEAILWHGGEANNSKEGFMKLPKDKREELIKFIEEL